MKRGADIQLTRDGRQDDDDIDDPGTGFKKAEDNIIAGRKMRGIPKRATTGGASVPLSAEAPKPSMGTFSGFGGASAFGGAAAEVPKPSFGGMSGFGGFGTSTSSTTGTTKPPTTTFGGFGGFGSKPASNSSNSTPTVTGEATSNAVSTSASASTKSFASVMSSTAPATTNGTLVTTTKNDESELQYYKSLRGLNLSILSAFERAVEADPFADMASHFKRYQDYRATIQRDYDSAKSTTTSTETAMKTSDASSASAPITARTSPSSFGGGFSFGAGSSSVASSGGFAPTADKSSKPSGFTFGGSSSASQPFAKAPETKPDTSAKPSFTTSTSSASLFGGKPAGADHDDDLAVPSGATSLFGSPANLTPTSGTPFNFAGSAFTPISAGNPFNASMPAGGSGFSFGGSSFKAPDPSNPFGLSSSSGASSAFSSATAAKPDTAEKEDNAVDDGAGLGLAPADHDKEGAGEEDEETTHAIKSRIYKWTKKKMEDGTEKDAWADMGYGVVRLKCHKEDGSRRMLSRNSSTGKITINFNLYPNLDVTVKGRNVLFIGRDESGVPVRMNVKPQTDAQATELQEAIQRDVQQLKKKT